MLKILSKHLDYRQLVTEMVIQGDWHIFALVSHLLFCHEIIYKFTCAAFSIYIEGGPNGGFGGFLSHHLALSEIPQERCGRRIAEPEQTGSVAAQGCGCFFYGWWFYIFMICVPDLDDDPKQRSKFDWGEIAQFSKFRSYREGFKDIWNGFENSVVWFCFSLENPWKNHVDSKPRNSSNKMYTKTYKDIHDVHNVLFEGNAQFVIIVFGCIALAILRIGSC